MPQKLFLSTFLTALTAILITTAVGAQELAQTVTTPRSDTDFVVARAYFGTPANLKRSELPGLARSLERARVVRRATGGRLPLRLVRWGAIDQAMRDTQWRQRVAQGLRGLAP